MASPHSQFDRERIAKRNYVQWVPCAHGHIPEHAVTLISVNGERAIVARAQFKGGIIPGKIIAGHTHCLIGTSNKEHAVPNYEVLVDPFDSLVWIPFTPQTMNYAVYGGHREKKPEHTLYVARASVNGLLTPGKLFKEESFCSVPFNGGEHTISTFDILVYN